jgi:hypothetical protein
MLIKSTDMSIFVRQKFGRFKIELYHEKNPGEILSHSPSEGCAEKLFTSLEPPKRAPASFAKMQNQWQLPIEL